MHVSLSLKIRFSTSTVRLFTTRLSAFLTYDGMQCIVIRSVLDGKHANWKLYTIYGATPSSTTIILPPKLDIFLHIGVLISSQLNKVYTWWWECLVKTALAVPFWACSLLTLPPFGKDASNWENHKLLWALYLFYSSRFDRLWESAKMFPANAQSLISLTKRL